jgi:hypothetical protein
MPTTTSSTLPEQLSYFLDVTRDATAWADTHAGSAGSANPVVLKQNLLEIAKSLNKYARALTIRPAVGLFGESQVGKSFLVSILGAMPGNTSVQVVDHHSGRSYDFLKQINPVGMQTESTGVITRFTVVPIRSTPATPFCVRLFTQAELVKIIANGYFLDFASEALRRYQFNAEEIYAVVARLKGRRSGTRRPEFTEEDIVDIKGYLEKIALKSISQFNGSSFWDDALTILPYINYNERWELLQFLWGKNDFFTRVFNSLSDGLSQTAFSKVLQVGEEALFPRESSIIDINRCNEIIDFTDGGSVNITCENGRAGRVRKGLLGALTAELEVNLPKELVNVPEMDFLREADVLDFPGCRSRQLNEDSKFDELKTIGKLEVFKRGKVAFLFEKYTDDFSVNTLITCIPPRTMEVKQLATYLYEWIRVNVGDSPQKRLALLNSHKQLPEFKEIPVTDLVPLMMAMTMFDKDLLGITHVDNDDPIRWKGRFYQNYYQFFGFEKPFENYLEEWLPTEERSFRNTFPIRNPYVDGDSPIFERNYPTQGLPEETGFSDKYKTILPLVRSSFQRSPDVQKLVRNTGDVFDSVATPGNYGARNLLRALNTVSRTKIKENLIYAHFKETRERFIALFNQFGWDSNADQAILKAKAHAAKAYGAVSIMQAKKNSFGTALHHFNLREDISFGVYFKMVNDSLVQTRDVKKVVLPETGEKIPLNEYARILGIPVTGQETPKNLFDGIRNFLGMADDQSLVEFLEQENVEWKLVEKKKSRDKADQFSGELLTKWASMIEELRSPEFCTGWGIKPEIVDLIIEQLNKSLLRVGLESFISASVREEIDTYHPVNNPNFDIVARISSSIVNRFVNSFGWYFVPNTERPLTAGNEIIFDEMNIRIPPRTALLTDTEDEGNQIFDNWRIGLMQSFERNLRGNFESAEKLMAIRRLKEILTPVVSVKP